MKQLSKEDQAKVDVLTSEISTLNDLIATEQDEVVVEELKQERTLLITTVNNIYGTDHIAKGSKMTAINNDLNKD